MDSPLDPKLHFQATKALRYLHHSQPFDTPPFSNSLAVQSALESQATLLAYADVRAAVVECVSHKAAADYDRLAAQGSAPDILAYAAKLKAFKSPEQFAEAWAAGVGEWERWLHAVEAHVDATEALLARVGATGRAEALAALNARACAAAQRMAEELAASLVVKLDARTLKKMAKAAEREKALKEAQEELEGGGAKGKAAKKVRRGAGARGAQTAFFTPFASLYPISAGHQEDVGRARRGGRRGRRR